VLPSFLVIGAAKSGTASLAHYLRSHPQVYLADFALRYFTAERRWRPGRAWHQAQFKGATDEAVLPNPAYLDTSRELDHEYNRTSQRPVRRPAPRHVKRLLNASVGIGMPPRTVERLFYRPGAILLDQASVALSDTTRSRLEDELRDDVRRLHRHLDPEFDGWGIA
jgi:hypothetical protein